MTINAITSISQFTNVGVVDSNEAVHTITPALKFAVATSVINDITTLTNDAFKFHLRMDTVTATSFKLMIGCNATGTGYALQFDFSASNKWIRLVTTSGINQAYDTVVQEVDMHNRLNFTDAQFIPCVVKLVDNKIQLVYNGFIAIDSAWSPTETHWGFCNLTASSLVYVSDIFHVNNQILFGNVNLDGAPDNRGIVMLYAQSTYDIVEVVETDTNGEYMIFIDDDPANLNKYFLYGYIKGLGTVQPRGVSNITL